MPVPAMQNKTVGIVGAGRIGAAYARMFAEGHKMDIVYFDPYPNKCACITARLWVLVGALVRHGHPPSPTLQAAPRGLNSAC